MPARFRVALLGFSDFERSTLGLCFRLAPSRIPAYDEVEHLSEAQFVVADAEGAGLVARLTQADRLGDTVFIGPRSVPGALAHVRRPIDPILVVRELDALSALRSAPPARANADAVPPPELTDDVSAEPPAESITAPGDLGEPTRPYVRVTDPEPDEAPPPEVETSEMFELPDVLMPEFPVPRAAEASAPAPAEPPAGAAATPGAEVPPEAAPPMAEPAPVWPDARTQAKARARAAAARRRNATQLVSGGDSVLEALVLDDNGIAAQYLGQLLEELGFHVHLAATSAEGLDVLTHQPITLACLDLTLGEHDELGGLDICQRIKHEPLALGGSPPLVVLVAGHTGATDRVRATLAGSDGYITKPFGKQDLVRVLESCGLTLLPTLTLPAEDRPPA